jgi:F0F1-type ATP synthase beta subunit
MINSRGKVISIRGSVVDVWFSDSLPKLHSLFKDVLLTIDNIFRFIQAVRSHQG